MEKTYSQIYIHFVFATKDRNKLIHPKIEKRLWSYISAVAKKMGITTLAIGGTEDHLHLLLSVPPNLSVSYIMQKLKSISSKWMNDTFYPRFRDFRWQRGYAAFSVGYLKKERVERYIRNQKLRHQKISFDTEMNLFMEKFKGESFRKPSVKKKLNAVK